MEKLDISLGNIQKTLLLPLWGRAAETQKLNPLLIDNAAVEIINNINYDFTAIAVNTKEITQIAWIGRSIITDRVIRQFMAVHPKATIVNIGCGLDTTFDRVDNGNIYWYDLDLPDVIELRKIFFCETERRKFISSSFLENSWLEQLNIEDNILFIAGGVFYYFEEKEVKEFLIKIAGLFPGCECLFDAASPFGVKAANKMVIKDTGFDEKSFLKWGLEKTKDIMSWNDRIEIINKHSFFKGIRNKLPFKTMLTSYVSDYLNVMYMVHLKMRHRPGC